MSHTRFALIAASLAAVMTLSACANTVRGAGRDIGNTVDATAGAVDDIAQ